MSKLSRADYTEQLVGKTIKRVHWCNDGQKKCLSLGFTDQTLCLLKFEVGVDEEVELLDFSSGNPPKQQMLTPYPLVRLQIKPLERE